MRPRDFLDDLHRKPVVLTALARSLRSADPWAAVDWQPERILLVGMGSSMYAAAVSAARLRARGFLAVAELASSDLVPQWGTDTLVVAVSASGSTRETLDVLDRLGTEVTTVALTNVAGSALSQKCHHTVLLDAEPEIGGVACRSFQHTLALLLALESHLLSQPMNVAASLVERAVTASTHLLRTERDWLPSVERTLIGPSGSSIAAPARRLSSAQQAALMLREGPRVAAVGSEVGDWAHVDVYLTKNTDYRLLLFAGSSWEDGILEWTRPRRTPVVVVGGDFPGAAFTLRYPHDDNDDVRLLVEVLVVELVAARMWLAQDAAG